METTLAGPSEFAFNVRIAFVAIAFSFRQDFGNLLESLCLGDSQTGEDARNSREIDRILAFA